MRFEYFVGFFLAFAVPWRQRAMHRCDATWLGRSCALGLLVGAAWLVAGAPLVFSGPASATEDKPPASNSEVTLPLDIPSQPLEDALYAFGAATGIEVFVDGGAVTGRRSAAVKGMLNAAQALRVLLTGTGLDAHPIGPRAITLSPGREERSSTAIYRDYSAILQNAALRQLCGERGIRFGTYRIAMQLWLNETGGAEHVELLSSTGDQARDRRIRKLLKGISIAKPPQSLPQPVVMVILPRSSANSGDCIAGGVWQSPLDIGDRRDGNR